jgi:hypothetical protein
MICEYDLTPKNCFNLNLHVYNCVLIKQKILWVFVYLFLDMCVHLRMYAKCQKGRTMRKIEVFSFILYRHDIFVDIFLFPCLYCFYAFS